MQQYYLQIRKDTFTLRGEVIYSLSTFEIGWNDTDTQSSVRLVFCSTVTTWVSTATGNNDVILKVQTVKQLDREGLPWETRAVCASACKSSCS